MSGDLPKEPDPTVQYDTQRLGNISNAMRELEHPKQIGRYVILEVVGEGGMGTVYRAEQHEPIHRIVAIKLIKLGMDTRDVISRFASERQVLALMDHPNVARVIDAGATVAGSPYFVMEYVKGEPITAFADRNKLDVRQRLELFLQACDAIQHAHQKAIIHRDLKPSNILVTSVDGMPRVKVIDFGVAKAIDQNNAERSYFTMQGQFIGTPEYMAPEQASGAADDIDTRGDIYSLGVVLYELLSGSLPFDPKTLRSAGYQEIQRIIREVDPPKPSTRLSTLEPSAREEVASLRHTSLDLFQKQLKGELEWIPLKAMRKERSERYSSATELSDDIQNYLSNRPLRAGPETNAYRARKFLRRNKTGVAASAVMLLLLLAGIATTTWQAIRARRQTVIASRERDTAQQERDNAEAVVNFFTGDVIGAADPAKTHGKPVTVQEAVDKAADKIDKSLSDRPLIEASVRLSISDTYAALGNFEKSLPFAKRAYELRRAQLGEDSWETILALSRYANVLIALRRPADAEPLARQILASSTRLKGPDDLETLAAENNLGNVFYLEGRFSDAAPIMEKHYRVLQQKFGDDSYDTMEAAHNYGAAQWRLGNFDEAEKVLRRAFEWSVKKYGIDDPDSCAWGNSLIVVLNALGKYDESVPLGKKIWDARIRILGKDSADTVSTGIQYASGLAFVGRGAEGVAILKQLADSQTARDPNDRLTFDAMQAYGLALAKVSRHEEAANVLREVWDKRKAVLERDHPDTLVAEFNYASELAQLHREAEAEPLARAALEGFRKSAGPKNADVTRIAALLVKILRAENRPADAAPIALEYQLPASTQPATRGRTE